MKVRGRPFSLFLHTRGRVFFFYFFLLACFAVRPKTRDAPVTVHPISRMILHGVVRADAVSGQMPGSSSQREISDDRQQP